MGKLKPTEPFRFEVRGRVCSIKEGAVLLTDGIEYGGTVVNWTEADTPAADKDFWPQYTRYRTTPFDGPSSFIQHEHLTRRQIKLRASYAAGKGKTAVLAAWPVRIRVGPLVRFVNADTATDLGRNAHAGDGARALRQEGERARGIERSICIHRPCRRPPLRHGRARQAD